MGQNGVDCHAVPNKVNAAVVDKRDLLAPFDYGHFDFDLCSVCFVEIIENRFCKFDVITDKLVVFFICNGCEFGVADYDFFRCNQLIPGIVGCAGVRIGGFGIDFNFVFKAVFCGDSLHFAIVVKSNHRFVDFTHQCFACRFRANAIVFFAEHKFGEDAHFSGKITARGVITCHNGVHNGNIRTPVVELCQSVNLCSERQELFSEKKGVCVLFVVVAGGKADSKHADKHQNGHDSDDGFFHIISFTGENKPPFNSVDGVIIL